ncbi:hypothetical protein RND81_02G160600 [Saponaria officinalis]|uniref:Uncharacterized protein n=1 Tax=Saponaria officinalis TaxID=3572 RepID=A0AAW1MWE5_SAPOF
MTHLLCISIFFDSIQGVLSGVSRGCGWQHLTTCINLATFYMIGMPVACVLAFKVHMYAMGVWIGLICGLIAQTCTLFLVIKLQNWTKIELSNAKRQVICFIIFLTSFFVVVVVVISFCFVDFSAIFAHAR